MPNLVTPEIEKSELRDQLHDQGDDNRLNVFFLETLKRLFNGCYAYFPAEWGPESDGWRGEDVNDPLTVYIISPNHERLYAFSIAEALKETIEEAEIDGSYVYGLERISKNLKDLSGNIDQAVAAFRQRNRSEG